MKKLIFMAVCVLALLPVEAYATNTNEDTLADATNFFQSYLDAYNAFSASAASQNYNDTVMVAGIGPSLVISSREDMANLLGTFLEGLKTQGVTSFKWSKLQVALLNARTAIASNTAVRIKADGTVHNTATATFLAHKSAAGWKIYSLALHAKGTELAIGN